ncbi:heterokaryon incompatibility protein-domain-containing protein [Xylariaceae sp. FL0016]|nr:heterokaryon incompatibility protein-domain-containing protein [Xylariaceae sp. FL0016]
MNVDQRTYQPTPGDDPEWKVENDYTKYRPLETSSKEIRLVTIRPGSNDDPIQCTLTRHAFPMDGSSFEALSYCWGSLRDTVDITLFHDATDTEGQHFNVTKTLDLALRRLRHEDQERMIWIDALCINQGSIKERNYAISFMADVYRTAETVIVFLGDEPRSNGKDMWSLVDKFLSAFPPGEPIWKQPDIGAVLERVNPKPNDGASDAKSSDFMMHVSLISESFFGNYPWFRRVWVIREVMNARNAVVYCGDERRNWLEVLLVLGWAIKSTRTYVSGWSGAGSSDLRDRLPPAFWMKLFATKHGDMQALARLPWLDVISKGRAFGATDPRDKVFALLSFGEETHDMASLPPRLVPDYAKSASQVWSDLTRQWILDHGSLDILAVGREMVDTSNRIAERTLSVSVKGEEDFPEAKPSYAVEEPPDGHPSWAVWHAEHPQAVPVALFRSSNELSRSSLDINRELLNNPKDINVLSLPAIAIDTVKTVHWPFKRWVMADDEVRQVNYNRTPPVSVEDGVAIAWGVLIGGITLQDNATQLAFRLLPGETNIPAYPNGSSLIQAFIQALVCQRFSTDYFAPDAPPMDLDPDTATQLTDVQRDEVQVMAHFAAHWAKGFDPDMAWMPGPWAERLRPLIKHGSSKRFADLCEYSEGRCFFQAERAGFGLCPRETRAGDMIVSLAGGRTPFVLRRIEGDGKHPECFSLIGECYLHDLDIKRITQARVDKGGKGTVISIV